MSWSSATVSIGDSTKKADYDRLMDNTIFILSEVATFTSQKTFADDVIFQSMLKTDDDVRMRGNALAQTAVWRKDAGGLLVPLYKYPSFSADDDSDGTTNQMDEDWWFNRFLRLVKEYEGTQVIVILNPSSGPGSSVDGNYTQAIKRLHGADVIVIGYVATNYTGTALATVEADVDSWYSFYPAIDGIFVDEMTNTASAAYYTYYEDLYAYCRTKGAQLVVGNPGTAVPIAYFDNAIADILVTYENSTVPSEDDLRGTYYSDSLIDTARSRRAALLYAQSALRYDILEMMSRYSGYLYVTDASASNPWASVSGYFGDVLRYVSTVDAREFAQAMVKHANYYDERIMDSGVELWELNTPECVSSEGQRPTEKVVHYEPGKLRSDGKPEYDNAWSKFTGRGVIGVFQATTNLVTDPEDLTTSNWSTANASTSLSDHYWNGHRFTKVTSDGSTSGAKAYQSLGAISSSALALQVVMRHVDSTTSSLGVRDNTAGTYPGIIKVTWATKTVSSALGSPSIVKTNWYGDDVVEVLFTVSITSGNTIEARIYPTYPATEAKSAEFTAIQVETLAYPTPYTPTSRPSGALVAPFSWDQQGTIELWVRPWFTYDVGADKYFIADFDGGSWHFAWRYSAADDKWKIGISDGTTNIALYSSQITSNADLWKWWHLKVTWDTVNDSYKFWVNGALADSSTTVLSAISFNNNISIGSIPKYTNPAGYIFNALITDLQYKDSVDETTTHYDNGRPYFAGNRILGESCQWRLP